MSQRRADWEARLVAWAERRVGEPFAWGRTDCVMLALEALDVQRERPWWAEQLAGRWHDRASGLRAAAALGTLEDWLLARGAHCRRALFAQPGDVLVLAGRRLPRAYVLLGRTAVSATPRDGVIALGAAALRRREDVLALGAG